MFYAAYEQIRKYVSFFIIFRLKSLHKNTFNFLVANSRRCYELDSPICPKIQVRITSVEVLRTQKMFGKMRIKVRLLCWNGFGFCRQLSGKLQLLSSQNIHTPKRFCFIRTFAISTFELRKATKVLSKRSLSALNDIDKFMIKAITVITNFNSTKSAFVGAELFPMICANGVELMYNDLS